MKIWVIGRGYPTPYNSMLGSFELDQAKLLARHGHDVTYIAVTLRFFRKKDKRGLNYFTEDGVSICTYSHFYFPGKTGIHLTGFEDNCWKKVLGYVRKKGGKPDIIHIHYPSMISSINVIDRYHKTGVKLIVTEHWTKVLINKLRKLELARLKYYTSNADCFITVGKSLFDAVNQTVDVKVPMEIVPNLVSPLFKPRKAKTQSPFTFIVTGRMVPHKRFDVIAKQFLRVFSKNQRVILKLVGDGSEMKKLKRICEGHSNIILTGALTTKNVAREVMTANALICYSSCETFAVPVIEAWACGLPVITLDTIPVSMYCDDTRGIIISDGNENDLGQAMKKIYANYDKYDKDSIAKYAKSVFSDEAIYANLRSIYNNDCK